MHTRLDQPPLIEDGFADLFLSNADRQEVLAAFQSLLSPGDRERVEREQDLDRALDLAARSSPVYGGVVVRARYVEDRLRDAVERGFRQYVVLGAGFDSFALRLPDWARDLRVIEIDQVSTLERKNERLDRAGVERPEALFQEAADLATEALADVLARTPHRRDAPTFFSALGLTPYLSLDANRRLFAEIASTGRTPSEVVFDYVDRVVFDATAAPDAARRLVAERSASGEPFQSGFRPDTLGADLLGLGLELVEDLDPRAAEARYCAGRKDGLRLGAPGHIAFARGRVPRL